MILPHNKFRHIKIIPAVIVLGALLITGLFTDIEVSDAQSVNELKEKISDRNKKISQLEQEIQKYEYEIKEISQEKQTLKNAIKSLDITSQKIEADIEATRNKIDASELKIRQLTLEIELQKEKMERSKEAISRTFQKLNQAESSSLVENFLAHDNLAEFWDELESLERFKGGVRSNYSKLQNLKAEAEETKLSMEANIDNLASLKSELASKHGAVVANKSEKDQLLEETQSEESKYQALLAEKRARREAFLKELNEFESQLNFAINPEKIPQKSENVFVWPLDKVVVTQYFGNTKFAQSGAYNGNGHNGIDLGTPVGTPVKTALSGVVKDLGDTDTVCRNASYGKWILVEHYNGLSSLYAHLSGFRVSKGQKVNTGEIIGYSGNTGYSTGPHLHFTVYATEGVRVMQRPSRACGGIYTMPVADLKAYLNPLDYLSI